MITAFVLAVVLQVAPSGEELYKKPIPEHWSYVMTLREQRARDMIKFGMEGEINEFRRRRAETILGWKLGYKSYPIRPGYRLVHVSVEGRDYIREIGDYVDPDTMATDRPPKP